MHAYIKCTCIKATVLTGCCGAGSGKESVMEDMRPKVNGHIHKNSTYPLLLCR